MVATSGGSINYGLGNTFLIFLYFAEKRNDFHRQLFSFSGKTRGNILEFLAKWIWLSGNGAFPVNGPA